MYTMSQVCEMTGMTYEGLKYYCNQGLIPYVKRDERGRRIFDDDDVLWIKHLGYIRRCKMSISELQEFVALCLAGERSIPDRKAILEKKRHDLTERIALLKTSLDYIDREIRFYEDVISGVRTYESGLVPKSE